MRTYEKDELTKNDLARLEVIRDRLITDEQIAAAELREAIAKSMQTLIEYPMAAGPYSPVAHFEISPAWLLGGVAA